MSLSRKYALPSACDLVVCVFLFFVFCKIPVVKMSFIMSIYCDLRASNFGKDKPF